MGYIIIRLENNMHNKYVHIVATLLLIVGGLNWLVIGAFDYNIVETVLGMGILTKVIYITVGLAALVEIFSHKKNCKACGF